MTYLPEYDDLTIEGVVTAGANLRCADLRGAYL